jgi:hypothetical protein
LRGGVIRLAPHIKAPVQAGAFLFLGVATAAGSFSANTSSISRPRLRGDDEERKSPAFFKLPRN